MFYKQHVMDRKNFSIPHQETYCLGVSLIFHGIYWSLPTQVSGTGSARALPGIRPSSPSHILPPAIFGRLKHGAVNGLLSQFLTGVAAGESPSNDILTITARPQRIQAVILTGKLKQSFARRGPCLQRPLGARHGMRDLLELVSLQSSCLETVHMGLVHVRQFVRGLAMKSRIDS